MFSASHPRYRHWSGAGVREHRGGTCHFGGAFRLGHCDWFASLLALRLAKTRKLGVVTLMGKQGISVSQAHRPCRVQPGASAGSNQNCPGMPALSEGPAPSSCRACGSKWHLIRGLGVEDLSDSKPVCCHLGLEWSAPRRIKPEFQ